MEITGNTTEGIELMVKECHSEFRRPENINFYSKEDLLEAERKYVKYCLAGLTHPSLKEAGQHP